MRLAISFKLPLDWWKSWRFKRAARAVASQVVAAKSYPAKGGGVGAPVDGRPISPGYRPATPDSEQ